MNSFLEARTEILRKHLLDFWSKWWHQKSLLKLTDFYHIKQARPHVRSYTLVVYPWELATTSRKQTYACKHEIHQFYLVLNALNKQVINFTHRNLLNLNQLLSVKLYVWDQKIFCLLSRNFKNHLTLVFNVQKGTWLGIYAKY